MARTCSTFANQGGMSSCDIYHLCDFKTPCFYLAVSWFGRVYIAMLWATREISSKNSGKK